MLYTIPSNVFQSKTGKKGEKSPWDNSQILLSPVSAFYSNFFFQNPTIVYVYLKYTVKGFSALHTTHTINIFILFNFNFGGKNCGKQQ